MSKIGEMSFREAQQKAAGMTGFFAAFKSLEIVLKTAADAPAAVKALSGEREALERSVKLLKDKSAALLDTSKRLDLEVANARVEFQAEMDGHKKQVDAAADRLKALTEAIDSAKSRMASL